uniref:RGH1A n=1 Tax=Oryza rufipogon TaxID=4529 RepID=A0A0E0QEW1_ORYRU
MELVTGAMGSLLPKLGELLKDEYDLQTGMKEKVKSLSRELESVHAVLRKVGEVTPEQLDELVKLWARDVRELSYDMEDIVDTFLVRIDSSETDDRSVLRHLRKKMSRLFKRTKDRRKIAGAIKEIDKKLQEVEARRARYTVDSIITKPAGPASIDPRLQALYKRSTELVGIDGPVDKVIKMLSLGDDRNMKIVSVVGFGGLGKTTLAKAVYDKLKPDFDCGVFVPVGRVPDIQKVLRDILIDFGFKVSDVMILDERQLIDKLQNFVQKMRCFIVIDDIWDKKSWELIRCALQDCKCGSRVVATTRISEVATHVGDVYKMQPLSRDDCEKLLYARIVDSEGKCLDSPSVEACDKILKKCRGVPLAIITIASLLASKPMEDWPVVYNSIGFGHEGNDDVANTRRILSFSYYDLPSHLKPCILYISIFPEDYEINKNLLIWKWIAEGFVHVEHVGIGLFEVGEGYFNELINRNMIQLVKAENEGYISSCRVHDMVLDMVRSLSSEENFVTLWDSSEKQKLPRRNARRLALQSRSIKEQNGNQLASTSMEQVRSFIANDCDDISMLFPRFRVLRVLILEDCDDVEDVEGCGGNSVDHLGSLLHLRYLGLPDTDISKLPKEVGGLKFLQTLDLWNTGIKELPQAVGLLTQLLCLHTDRSTTVPAGLIGKLTSLQELWTWPGSAYYRDMDPVAGAASTRRFAKELGNLRELRVLRASIYAVDESTERDLMESLLGNLQKIQSVDIFGSPLERGVTWDAGFASRWRLRHLNLECFELSRLPASVNSSLLPNLSHLDMKVQVMQEQDMETLGRLPELRCLVLDSRYTKVVRIKNTGSDCYFKKLRFFTMGSSSILFDVQGSECAIMPSLESLAFSVHVRFLKDADLLCFKKLGLVNLPSSLQRVTVEINSWDAHDTEVEEAEAMLEHAAIVHPNHPIFQTTRPFGKYIMLLPDQEPSSTNPKVDRCDVNLRKNDGDHLDFRWLLMNPRVEKFCVSINCENASLEEVEEAEAAARYAVDVHPNCPTLELVRYGEDKMVLPNPQQQVVVMVNLSSFLLLPPNNYLNYPHWLHLSPPLSAWDGVRGVAASATGGTTVPVINPAVSAADPASVVGEKLKAAVLAANPVLAASAMGGGSIGHVGGRRGGRSCVRSGVDSGWGGLFNAIDTILIIGRGAFSIAIMELVMGAMENLIPKLGELLKEEYVMQSGVREKIQSVSRELESIHAALRKIGKVPWEHLDDELRLWAHDLREASYDMEDIIDSFLVRVDGHEASEVHWFKWFLEKMTNQFNKIKASHEIGVAMKEIDEKLQEVATRHARYTIDNIAINPAGPATVDPRLLSMYKTLAELVGIEGPMDELMKMLDIDLPTKKRKIEIDVSVRKPKMVSIFGFGGLGKTTLAKAVYDKLKPSFDSGAFIPVGQNPNIRKVFRDILMDLDKQSYNDLNLKLLDERQLINKLQEFLQKKRCFVVIDDIWDKDSWRLIRCALQDSNHESRVVTTTRIYEVATQVGEVYKMHPLSHDESKKLLYTRIISGEGESLRSTSVEACDKILKKCGGVPLAIIIIASLLANKPREYWSEVYNSIGLEHGYNDDVDNTRRILSLSYYDLPLHLKPCLLYLSIFPEDYYIEKNLLIWKWIAEGFVHEKQAAKLGLFETGEGYFNELINRSMIQPVEHEYSGYMCGCRVHDMVLDLILLLSGEENFVTVVDGSKEHELSWKNARRLALQHWSFEENRNQLANMGVKQTRSLIMTECFDKNMQLPSFQVLRVLEIQKQGRWWNIDGKINLQHVRNLLHLRFLHLDCIDSIPLIEQFRNLRFLQVLHLKESNIQELPESVGLLTKLLSLRVDIDVRVSPGVIEKLTSLQELYLWPYSDDTFQFVKVLGKLRELRVLHAKNLKLDGQGETSALLESLCNLHKIQTLDIDLNLNPNEGVTWDAGFTSPQCLRYLCLVSLRFHRMPEWINWSLLPNLSYLELRVNFLEELDLETLGRLPKLRYLHLFIHCDRIVSIGKIAGAGDACFQELRFLNTPYLYVRFDQHGIMCSKDEKAVMPNVKTLSFCVYVRILKDTDILGFDKLFSFAHLGRSSLQQVQVNIQCRGARAMEVEEAEAALAHAAAIHPNRPTLQIHKFSEGEMLPPHEEPSSFFPKVVVENLNAHERKDDDLRFVLGQMLQRNPCVKKFSVSINCENACLEEVEKAEAAARYAVDFHANRPTLELVKYGEDKMVLSGQHQQRTKTGFHPAATLEGVRRHGNALRRLERHHCRPGQGRAWFSPVVHRLLIKSCSPLLQLPTLHRQYVNIAAPTPLVGQPPLPPCRPPTRRHRIAGKPLPPPVVPPCAVLASAVTDHTSSCRANFHDHCGTAGSLRCHLHALPCRPPPLPACAGCALPSSAAPARVALLAIAIMDLMKAMGRLLPKLGQMLKDEYDLHTGIRKKIQSLSRELEDVHAVLRMVGEVPPEQLDGTVELWAHDLREASYDMDLPCARRRHGTSG